MVLTIRNAASAASKNLLSSPAPVSKLPSERFRSLCDKGIEGGSSSRKSFDRMALAKSFSVSLAPILPVAPTTAIRMADLLELLNRASRGLRRKQIRR
jgi:hypothetical protein